MTWLGWWGRLIDSVCPLAAKLGTMQRHSRNRASHNDRRRIMVDYNRSGYGHLYVRFGLQVVQLVTR